MHSTPDDSHNRSTHQQQQQVAAPVQAAVQQSPAPASDKSGSTTANSHEHIRSIVEEEKVSKNKMPNYPGLERFKLQEKMGECVS